MFPGTQGGPLEHVIAAKAVAFGEALTDDFQAYARQVVENAKALADALIERGFAIVSGGTDTHLMLVDLRPKNLTGKAAEKMLGQAGITVNKNTIPDDPQSPFVTSGIRLGTPALTTRGMGAAEMVRVAELIDRALTHPDEATLARVKAEVEELTSTFPLYAPAQAAGRVRRTRQSSRSSCERVGERSAVRRRRAGADPRAGRPLPRARLPLRARHHRVSAVPPRGPAARDRRRAGLGLPRLRPRAVRPAGAASCSRTGASPAPRTSAASSSRWSRSGCW